MSRHPADDLLYINSIFDRDGLLPLRGTAWNDSDRDMLVAVRQRVLDIHDALIGLVEATADVITTPDSPLTAARDKAVSALRG